MTSPQSPAPTLELLGRGRQDRLYKVAFDVVRIGRGPSSEILLDDGVVSGNHARIDRRPDGSYWVTDLRSRNTTALDGRTLAPGEPAPLRDGSKIRVARKYDMIFHLRSVVFRAEEDDGSTVIDTVSDLTTLSLAARSRHPAKALRLVLDVSRSLGGSGDLNEVLVRALDALLAVFPQAEGGFVVTREEGEPLRTQAVRHPGGPGAPAALSRSVCERVLDHGQALRVSDTEPDAAAPHGDSVFSDGVRTALCVPLAGHDSRPVGMIQVDSRSGDAAFSADDLELLAALAVPIGIAVENHALVHRQASWSAAREIQEALLPRQRPAIPGYAFWESYAPALAVGGDLYDYVPVRPPEGPPGVDPRWVVAVGDVAGKGMPAALLMAGICPEIRHLAQAGVGPAETLAGVNRRLCERALDSRFVTLALAELDARAHRLAVANAGHPDVLIRRAGGRITVLGREEAGPPLGVSPGEPFLAGTAELGPGDVVVLVSDGVTDALNRKGEPFGLEALLQAVGAAPATAAGVGEAVAEAVRRHATGQSAFDDITIVCFGRAPRPDGTQGDD